MLSNLSQFSRGRLVLDIQNGKKSGILEIVKPERGRPSQLWRWDEGCRLVSKVGLVVDIKGASKDKEAICHAWKAHDGLSQKWRVEKGAIRSNLSHLVIDGSPPRNHVLMRSFDECNENQKWYFVPEEAWDDFQISLSKSNPLLKALFWKSVADNYLDVIMGYSIEEFEARVHKAFEVIDECTKSLEEVAKGTGIARQVSGGVSVVGGGVTLAGVLLAPLTAGASLALTTGRAIGMFSGTVAALAAKLVHGRLDEHNRTKVNEATASLFCATHNFHSLLNEYGKYLKEADEFLEKQKHETCTDSVEEKVVAAEECTLSDTARTTCDQAAKNIYGQVREIKGLLAFMEANSLLFRGADVGISTSAEASGVADPVVEKTLPVAVSTDSKASSGSLAAFGVLIGVLDIYSGAKEITNSSELAEEFRQSSECLREEADRLIRLYRGLRQIEDSIE
ncbi:Apolipoprotein L3 [Stylophora pistillata]|uniref:Apolipoprotein L3 n=1 Tax=Stylophora pistillata TaxID=50429 RepID=A0A2B4R932_STYPI|nr:Apolipoprotein L3 [Stylophora pistillata]